MRWRDGLDGFSGEARSEGMWREKIEAPLKESKTRKASEMKAKRERFLFMALNSVEAGFILNMVVLQWRMAGKFLKIWYGCFREKKV